MLQPKEDSEGDSIVFQVHFLFFRGSLKVPRLVCKGTVHQKSLLGLRDSVLSPPGLCGVGLRSELYDALLIGLSRGDYLVV